MTWDKRILLVVERLCDSCCLPTYIERSKRSHKKNNQNETLHIKEPIPLHPLVCFVADEPSSTRHGYKHVLL
jgi:hypothetical protein